MQLTTARLKQIIKEELEAITNEMTETETEVETVDAEIASLEQQLAEAKKAKAAKLAKQKMPAKRDTGGMKKVGPEQTFSSAKSAMKTVGKKGK
jgi:predicted  nucleic acid-binding Zn-ribbon protein